MKISIRQAKFAKIGILDMIIDMGDVGNFKMVEIGSYVGDSAEIFAKRVKEIHCIDPFKNGYDEGDKASDMHDMKIIEKQFDEMISNYNNIFKIKAKSETVYHLFEDSSLDMVYIDGLHTFEGVTNDIKLWLPKIKEGGYICGHDYNSKHFPGVKKAVNKYFIPDSTYRDSSWLKKV